MAPELSSGVDTWIARQTVPRPTRPDAIRQLIALGLQTAAAAASLDQRIAKQEQWLARKIPAKRSPEKGMAVLQKGLAEVEHRKLVAKKKKADTSGQMRAAEPDLECRPKQAQGKKGSDVQDGPPARRATSAITVRAKPRKPKA